MVFLTSYRLNCRVLIPVYMSHRIYNKKETVQGASENELKYWVIATLLYDTYFCETVLTQSFNLAVSEYNRLRLQYEAALVNYKKEIKYTNIVAEPYVADKKFYPLRGLIVLITVLSALIISSVTFVYIEKIKQIK